MLQIRKSQERGHFNHGWLDTYHSFSFAEYQDPNFMGFRALRVINEDRVAAGRGFPMHSHQNMEIITYILEGALEHKDSMGNGSIIVPGDVQYMNAGTGVTHSESNPSPDQQTHLIQIWILPNQLSTHPSYDQKHFDLHKRTNEFYFLASNEAQDNVVKIHQDVNLYALVTDLNNENAFNLNKERFAWVQILRGSFQINEHVLTAGDGASIMQETQLHFKSLATASELLLFDLA